MLGLFGLIINILLIFYINRVFGIKIIKPEWSEILKSYIQNFLLFLSSATSFISTNGGLIILSFFSVAETLGMYSLAERVVMVLRLFPALIIQAIFPNASKLYQADPVRFYKFLKNVYLRVLLAGIFISAGTHFAAPWIIQVLSRSDLQESVMYLKILAAVPFLACLNVGNVTLLLVADLKELLFKASWMMCVYMIIVSAILTYYFGGIGLCFGIISTEIIVFLICLVLLYRHEKNLVHGFYS